MSESVLLAALELPESIILGEVILGACYIVGTLIETRSIVRARAYQIEDQLDPRCPIEPGANLKLITAETVLEAGMAVVALQGGVWWNAEVVAVEAAGMVRVSYDGWNEFEVIARERIMIDPEA